MKLRLDILHEMTEEDLLEMALANQHRYKAEPLFAKTGVGYLSPTSPEDYARDEEIMKNIILRALKRLEEKSQNTTSPEN